MKKVSVFILACVVVLSLAAVVSAEDIYVAQTSKGSNTGTDESNAHPMTWLNTSGNWANPKRLGLVGPGDTVHLCGTITTSLTVQGSGSQGSPITILFESGTKFSKAYWGQTTSAAIYASGKSYITIDGGTNGAIEATDNGTNKAYRVQSAGIWAIGCSHWEIKNLSVLNMYDRAEGSDANNYGSGIRFSGGTTDLKIHDCTMRQANCLIGVLYSTGDRDIYIYNNNLYGSGEGNIVVGDSNSNQSITNIQIYNNTLDKGVGEWSGSANIHTNCIHAFAVSSGSSMYNLKIFNNRFTGKDGTNSTSYCFLEGFVYSPMVYNNLFVLNIDFSGNGMMVPKGTDQCLIANNTFIGNGTGTAIGTTSGGGGMDTNLTVKNNLFYNVYTVIYDPTKMLVSSDYNVFYMPGGANFVSGSGFRIFSSWQGFTSFDSHSTTSQPSLDVNGVPTAGDAVAVGKGTNLSAFFTQDFNGNNRPSSGPWTIGAFETSTTPPPFTVSTPKSLRVMK